MVIVVRVNVILWSGFSPSIVCTSRFVRVNVPPELTDRFFFVACEYQDDDVPTVTVYKENGKVIIQVVADKAEAEAILDRLVDASDLEKFPVEVLTELGYDIEMERRIKNGAVIVNARGVKPVA